MTTKFAWLLPILIILCLTPFSSAIDLAMARNFYIDGHFSSHPFFVFVYEYGTLPGLFVGIGSLAIFILSYLIPRTKGWRPHALFLLLTLVMGAGVISHALLKDHWGRPRPRQVIEFGGIQDFRPYYSPNFFDQPEPSKAFPCGHCTMGFYFFAFALLGKRLGSRTLQYGGLLIALVLGGILGIARIAQGGHFFFDVLFSALIMWLTALVLDWLIHEETA